MTSLPPRLPGALLLLAGLALCGCSAAPPPAVNTEEAANLRAIQEAYNAVTRKLGRPPNNLNELKPALQERGHADEVLRSPRDGQPYVILWGVKPGAGPTPGLPAALVAYEKEGAAGKRYVLTTLGVVPLADEEFARVTLPK